MDVLSSIGCCWSIALGFFLYVVPMQETLGMVLVHEKWSQIFAKSKIGVVHDLFMKWQQRFFFCS